MVDEVTLAQLSQCVTSIVSVIIIEVTDLIQSATRLQNLVQVHSTPHTGRPTNKSQELIAFYKIQYIARQILYLQSRYLTSILLV